MIACARPTSAGWRVEEAVGPGDPWRSVLAGVARWAELRVRNRKEDRIALLVARAEQRTAEDLLRAAGWTA